MTLIPSLGGLQGHCYISGLEVMLTKCVRISTESCELLAIGSEGREELTIPQRKANGFWRIYS
jgi:hypothetical protein